MPVSWDNYHVGFSKKTGLFIGNGQMLQGGQMKWASKSKPRNEEIIKAVIAKLSNDLYNRKENKKPYVGYELSGVGKLVFIKHGYRFEVKPDERRT